MPEYRMPTHNIDAPRGAVDERWIEIWLGYGFEDLAAYLKLHAAFDQYCVEHGYGA